MKSERKKNNYKYFIYAIREYFLNDKVRLDNRKFDSFKLLLDDYVKLENQISNEKNDKLERAKVALMDNIAFYIDKTLLKYSDVLGTDVRSLKNVIVRNKTKDSTNDNMKDVDKNEKKRNNSNRNIFYIISSLQKKIEKNNIIEIWIDLLIHKASCYDDVDIILDCLVSELIYMGYSTEYIYEWWKQKFDKDEMKNGDLEVQVKKFIGLGINTSKEYDVLLCMQLPKMLKLDGNLMINKLKYELKDDKSDEFSRVRKNDSILLTKVRTIDKYRAIEIATSTIENYIRIYQSIDNSINDKVVKACIIYGEGIKLEREMHNRKSNIRELSNREKEDIEDFIEIRNNNELNQVENPNIVDIENVINIIQKLPEFTKENRMLNLWNSMENLARFYEGKSIVSKITDIIPKIVTMYILKQKMNFLWDRLIPVIKKNHDLQECRFEGKDNKYSREKFLRLLIDEIKSLDLFNQVQENILTQRSLLEMHELLKEKDKLENLVDLTHTSIVHSLNSIYRVRNDLVHNGGTMSSAMENQTRHLQKLLNHFLGFLIYHMKRNEEILIPEIIYSIDSTYEEFRENIDRINKLMKEEGEKITEKENEIKQIKDNMEQGKKQEELKDLFSSYEEKLIAANIEKVVFPQYLYLL